MAADFTIRPARPQEAAALAQIQRDGRAAIPITNDLHSFEEVTAYHAGLIAHADVRVAADGQDRPLAYAARDGGVLAQFYVDPAAFRRGIGRAMLAAMLREGPLTLWCFAHNARALAFYRTFGAVEIGREHGPENEEGLPAIQLRIEAGAR